ncbi:MAG: hypothetical protein ACFWUC_11705 [Oscillospiraceae bacterium]|jgi:hypothetical protein
MIISKIKQNSDSDNLERLSNNDAIGFCSTTFGRFQWSKTSSYKNIKFDGILPEQKGIPQIKIKADIYSNNVTESIN